jgi:purine-binding chemotaxis protein CheW
VGYETYALELMEIQEVVENCRVYPVPAAPPEISGAIAFHGRIVPVIDLPLLLGFPSVVYSQRLIVLVNERGPMALAVDQIRPLISLEKSFFEQSSDAEAEQYVRTLLGWNGEMISLLDLARVQETLEAICLS